MPDEARMQRLASNIPGLDRVLGGGFSRGGVYIFSGPPGAGKTICANQIAFGCGRAGGRALYVTLMAEPHDRLFHYLRSLSFFDPKLIPDRLFYVSGFEALSENPDDLVKLIAFEARRLKADIIVLDGLFAVQSQLGDEPAFRKFLYDVQGLAGLLDVTVFALTNQGRPSSAPEYTIVDGWLEFLDEMQDARAVRGLVVRKQRGEGYLRGRHGLVITADGAEVFPRFESYLGQVAASGATSARVSTGVEGLDAMLHGGLPEGSATVLMGPPGAGKTTFGLHFLSQSIPERRGLFVALQETPDRLLMRSQRLGVDLEGLQERQAVELLWVNAADMLSDQVAQRVLQAVERGDCRYLVFDGLTAYRSAFLYADRLPLVVQALNATLAERGATIIYTLDRSELFLPQDAGPLLSAGIADNVILLHYALREDVIRRNLTILKMRDSDFDPVTREFFISGRGVRLGERPQTEAESARGRE